MNFTLAELQSALKKISSADLDEKAYQPLLELIRNQLNSELIISKSIRETIERYSTFILQARDYTAQLVRKNSEKGLFGKALVGLGGALVFDSFYQQGGTSIVAAGLLVLTTGAAIIRRAIARKAGKDLKKQEKEYLESILKKGAHSKLEKKLDDLFETLNKRVEILEIEKRVEVLITVIEKINIKERIQEIGAIRSKIKEVLV